MHRRLFSFVLLGAAFVLGTALGQDHKEANPKQLAKVKDAVKAQKDHPKAKGDIGKDATKKIHDLEVKCETTVKLEEKVDAKSGNKTGAGAKKADGAAHALAATIKHTHTVEANAGQTKDAHHKQSADKVKQTVNAQKKKPASKDELKKEEANNLLAIEVKIEVCVTIDVKLDKEAEHEHKGDACKKADAEIKKLKACGDKIHAAEADEAAWLKDLADRVWLEAMIHELHADIDDMWALIHDLDSIGLHEIADEIQLACGELEDLVEDLADEWLLLHLDELKPAEVDTLIVWVVDLDEWHECDAHSWEQDLEDAFWLEALLADIHDELDLLEADLLALEGDLHSIGVEVEHSCESCEVILFDVGVEWVVMHEGEWEEHQLVEYEVWVVELEPHAA